ncbi:RP-L23, MRPL23, rplW [Ceraceosorus bombacis]|uniref:Large ribosomal subunit protein uL23m n=1 Tax=Ceraceosorus bombacis TaxID=401625 RepID=A0A0P1BBN7_9BASI|nr:RP-L23, MRPL23, rplW [Ceraceosorus bombacis]
MVTHSATASGELEIAPKGQKPHWKNQRNRLAVSYTGLRPQAYEATQLLAKEHRPTVVKAQDGELPLQTQAALLLRWDWIELGDERRSQLWEYLRADAHKRGGLTETKEQLENDARVLQWLRGAFELARGFRAARSRLWVPQSITDHQDPAARCRELIQQRFKENEERLSEYRDKVRKAELERDRMLRMSQAEVQDSSRDLVQRFEAFEEALKTLKGRLMLFTSLKSKYEALAEKDRESALDVVLKEEWEKLTEEKRQDEMQRLRFQCILRLGWRKGYTAAQPLPVHHPNATAERAKVRHDLVFRTGHTTDAAKRHEARVELQKLNHADLWDIWTHMRPDQRRAEEKAAWAMRDRSRIYINNTSDHMLLGATGPRWYATPQIAGVPTYLPTYRIALVRNATGEKYRNGDKLRPADPWKATFRVPLRMSKHEVLNYLRDLYGLHATWYRSLIYRNPRTRDLRAGGRWVQNQGHRSFKKVEVGLVEPFLFPEMTDAIRENTLAETEARFENARILKRISAEGALARQRWRATRPMTDMLPERYRLSKALSVAKDEGEIKRLRDVYEDKSGIVLDATTVEQIGPNSDAFDKQGQYPLLSTRKQGFATAKTKHILRVMHQRRLDREERIKAKMAQTQADEEY